MKIDDAVKELDGCEYREEGSPQLWSDMNAAGLVAVFGGSDDLVYLAGAADDELGAAPVYLSEKGILKNDCDSDCPYFREKIENAPMIKPKWCENDVGASWTYETDIPHKTFNVMEDGDIYCVGIVFDLNNLDPSA